MNIIKTGEPTYSSGEFRFTCKNCGCKWGAERHEVKFTPPMMEFGVYMDCPNCKSFTINYQTQTMNG